jgi:uncharacterized protein (TIGR03435 family)
MTNCISATNKTGINLLGFVLSILIAVPCWAQTTTQAPPSFEVASIRIDGPDHGFTLFPTFPATRFIADNMSMTLLITAAFDIPDSTITSKPGWFDSTFYSVNAKPEGDAALTYDQYKPLLQQLLKQRFKLAFHHETRGVPGYVLVVAKDGPKLTPGKDTSASAYILPNGLRGPSLPMRSLAAMLARPLGRPVIDKTGIAGNYDISLSYAPAASTDSSLPSIFTAVQEQLGLKLEPQKVPQDFLVIDHIEKVPTEN